MWRIDDFKDIIQKSVMGFNALGFLPAAFERFSISLSFYFFFLHINPVFLMFQIHEWVLLKKIKIKKDKTQRPV